MEKSAPLQFRVSTNLRTHVTFTILAIYLAFRS
jgi:hypothetical protein